MDLPMTSKTNCWPVDSHRKVTIFHDVGSAKQTCLHLGRATKRVEIDEQIFCAVLLGFFWEMKKNQQLWVCLHPHIMNIEHVHVVDLGQKSSKVLYFAFSWRWPIFQREEVMGYGSSPALVVILSRKEGAYVVSAIDESDISTCRANATSYHRWCMIRVAQKTLFCQYSFSTPCFWLYILRWGTEKNFGAFWSRFDPAPAISIRYRSQNNQNLKNG